MALKPPQAQACASSCADGDGAPECLLTRDLGPGTGGDQDPDGAGRSAVVGGSWGRLTGDMRADARSGLGQRTPREAAAGACRWTYKEDES